MVHYIYGPSILGQLTVIVDDWLSVLTDSGENDRIIANYYPAMLSAEGRAWLCIKIFTVLSKYMHCYPSLARTISASNHIMKTKPIVIHVNYIINFHISHDNLSPQCCH